MGSEDTTPPYPSPSAYSTNVDLKALMKEAIREVFQEDAVRSLMKEAIREVFQEDSTRSLIKETVREVLAEDVSPRLDRLEQRVAALEQRVAGFEAELKELRHAVMFARQGFNANFALHDIAIQRVEDRVTAIEEAAAKPNA